MRLTKFSLLVTVCFSALVASSGVFAQTNQEGVTAAREGRLEEAREIWETAAADGDAAAMRNLAGLYLTGLVGPQDYDRARELFISASELGDAQAMLGLGHIHNSGLGIETNPDLGFDWFNKAADLGNVEAKFMAAKHVFEMGGQNEDVKEALERLRDASDAGYGPAQSMVASFYRTGTFVESDPAKAIEFYRSASENGVAEALNEIGDMYLFAELGAPEIDLAVEAYQKASEQGDTKAMYSVAYLFYNSPDADQAEMDMALRYAQAAALGWNEAAQLLLGKMLLDDIAAPKDPRQAYFWLDLAASAGVIEAHHLRALAFVEIGAEEAAKVHAEAAKWFAENHSTPHVHRLISGAQHNFN